MSHSDLASVCAAALVLGDDDDVAVVLRIQTNELRFQSLWLLVNGRVRPSWRWQLLMSIPPGRGISPNLGREWTSRTLSLVSPTLSTRSNRWCKGRGVRRRIGTSRSKFHYFYHLDKETTWGSRSGLAVIISLLGLAMTLAMDHHLYGHDRRMRTGFVRCSEEKDFQDVLERLALGLGFFYLSGNLFGSTTT